MDTGPLSADLIFDVAAGQDGLSAFADDGVRRRFALLIETLNDAGRLQDWQRARAEAQLVEMVRRRLRLGCDWAEHPEIAQERIEQPFFVVGAGRSGTTLMQALLALGDGFRTPLSWEVRHPCPAPGVDAQSESTRILAENDHIEDLINLAPGLLLSHPYVDQKAFMECEDEDLFAIDFHTAFAWHLTHIPILPIVHHKAESGLLESFRFHKRMLQHLQWKRPTAHWVLKSAQHYFQLPVSWQVYPDAVCVWTHRDPLVFVPSVIGIIEHVYGPLTGMRMHGAPAAEIMRGLAAGYEAILAQDWLSDDRIIHVDFDEFVRDQAGTIRGIYERTGLEFNEQYADRIRRWLAAPANQADRHGRYRYSLEQFGLQADDVRARFAGYYDRFLQPRTVSR